MAYQTQVKETTTNDKTTSAEPVKPFESSEPIAEEKELTSAQEKPTEKIQEVKKKASPKPIKKEMAEIIVVLDDEVEMDLSKLLQFLNLKKT